MRSNPVYRHTLKLASWITVTILALIIVFVIAKSVPYFANKGWSSIFTDKGWFPMSNAYNMLPMLYASLLIAISTALVAGPLGVLLAVFINFYSPRRIARVFRALIDLLAGLPSVVYGFWGLIVLVPLINSWIPPGASVLAAVLVLSLMVLPLVVIIVDQAITQVPLSWRQAADSLSIRQWSYIYKIVLPTVRPAIISGIFLQVGRALGETMAVLMVCGNIVQYPHNPFQPARTLTANIALEMGYASGTHADALFVSALLLLLTTMLVIYMAAKQKKFAYEFR